jgi:hypothetical protein
MMFIYHRKHTYRHPQPVTRTALLFVYVLMFVPDRKHTYGTPRTFMESENLCISLHCLLRRLLYLYPDRKPDDSVAEMNCFRLRYSGFYCERVQVVLHQQVQENAVVRLKSCPKPTPRKEQQLNKNFEEWRLLRCYGV